MRRPSVIIEEYDFDENGAQCPECGRDLQEVGVYATVNIDGIWDEVLCTACATLRAARHVEVTLTAPADSFLA